jgi:hypothetical protein
MFPGSFMMGAQDRLLPPSVPYRFFAAATVFHVAAWAVLLAADPAAALMFRGGDGLVLAALHLVTLGVLAMSAMGAAVQLLPVATRRRLGPVWACRLVWWLFTPGVAALTLGFAVPWTPAQHLGATLVVAAFAVFGALVVANLRSVDDLPGVTRHSWLAIGCLAALAVLGVVLIADFGRGFLPDRSAVASAHAVLAGYGFMGMLAMGFSTVLIPMFVLGPPVPDKVGRYTSAFAGVGLAVGVAGALAGEGALQTLGVALGAGALALHLRAIRTVLKGRMRRKLEPFFRTVMLGWAMLVASLLAALALAFGAPQDPLATLWAFLLVFGWLLTFVLGILQRIMPFLASMHTSGLGGKPALLSQLTAETPLKVHLGCHAGALALIALAVVAGQAWAMRGGAALGLAGAVSFAVFAVQVLVRTRAHLAAQSVPPSNKTGE